MIVSQAHPVKLSAIGEDFIFLDVDLGVKEKELIKIRLLLII
jgi:hypothetical protein